jgi:hypothetical protein
MGLPPIEPFSPEEVGKLFAHFSRPWWIAGGWALDLFLGRRTRDHADIEVALLRDDQVAVREHLVGWELRFARDHELHAWPDNSRLELPIHELWGRRRGRSWWEVELLLNECADGEWRFRRDMRVRRPLAEIGIATDGGLPALAPEIVLLYKAANPQLKDENDLAAVQPALDDRQSEWLNSALELVHPGHPWLQRQ